MSLLIGVLLALVQYFLSVLPARGQLAFSASEGMIPHSVFSKWMGAEQFTFVPTLYFTALPILAALPYGESYFRDLKSGYVRQLVLCSSRARYLRAKYLAVYLSAGLAVLFPLVLNLLLSMATLPSITPSIAAGYFPLGDATRFLPGLPYESPYLYTAVYLAIIFLFSGAAATVSLAVAPFATNRFVVCLAPFGLICLVGYLCSFLGCGQWNPLLFLNPSQPVGRISFFTLGISFLLLAGVPALLFFRRGAHSDLY